MSAVRRSLLIAVGMIVVVVAAEASVEMENQARQLGFPVTNCLYCHASPHASETMKQRASSMGIAPGNCLACHGSKIPAALNHRGEWLVAEKSKRGAKQFDMAWLRDYKEPAAAPTPTPKPKATPKPEVIKVAPSGH
jgi:hypothetical protein